jgi:hypothetical protein
LGPHAALQLVAEIGIDMSRWKTAKHFTSWLTLAPNNKISGGRLLSSKTQPSANRAAAILRRFAMSLTRTSTALGAFYRRLAARTGKATAITATACKFALLVYRVLRGDITYSDPGADAQLYRARALKTLRKRAQQLDFGLNSGELLPAQTVSWEEGHPAPNRRIGRFELHLCLFRQISRGRRVQKPAQLALVGLDALRGQHHGLIRSLKHPAQHAGLVRTRYQECDVACGVDEHRRHRDAPHSHHFDVLRHHPSRPFSRPGQARKKRSCMAIITHPQEDEVET